MSTATAARTKVREPVAAEAARPAREPERKPNPNVLEWVDSTGKVWTRNRYTQSDNVLDFPLDQVPEGFTYQWVRESVYGQEDRANIMTRGRNSWSPVPPDRHPDRVVRYEGLILMECPTVFVEASREEERKRAAVQRRDSMPGMTLPSGFDATHPGAKQNTFARVGTPVPADPAWKAPYKAPDIDG